MSDNFFVAEESVRRLADYRPDANAIDIVKTMNLALAPAERYEPSGIARPNIFIFGLPRSGTTLLYQLLSCCLDLGYINNIAARFWLAPRTGVALARAVLGERRDASFRSDYGKSVDPAGPHEFSYFWQKWLGIETVEDILRFGESGDAVDWSGLNRVMGSLQDFFGTGMVHKTNFVANFTQGFLQHLPLPLLVYIERDPMAVALSILRARKAYYGDAAAWWATYPPTYHDIKGLPFATQIARQVFDLRRTYAEVIAAVDPALVLRFSYEELCRRPADVLNAIRARVAERHGVEVGAINIWPEAFDRQRSTDARTAEEVAVADAASALAVATP